MRVVDVDRFGQASRLAFGTASLHRIHTEALRQRLLALAADLGITHFDTAPLYGYGMAERVLGSCFAASRSTVTIATKVGLYPPKGAGLSTGEVYLRKILGKFVPALSKAVVDFSVSKANMSLEASLRRLRREQVDVLFLHEPVADLVGTDEMGLWLEKCRAAGRVRAYGLSAGPARVASFVDSSLWPESVLQLDAGPFGGAEAFLSSHGRKPQFTYGHLAALKGYGASLESAINTASARFKGGSLVVGTTNEFHLRELCEHQCFNGADEHPASSAAQ